MPDLDTAIDNAARLLYEELVMRTTPWSQLLIEEKRPFVEAARNAAAHIRADGRFCLLAD